MWFACADFTLAPTLQWHTISSGSQQHMLQARARHATFVLPALQPVQQLEQLQQLIDNSPRERHPHLSKGWPAVHEGDAQLASNLAAAHTNVNSNTAGCQFPRSLQGCLVMFGGISAGGTWLKDTTLLLLQANSPAAAAAASCTIHAVSVPQWRPQGSSHSGAESLPVPVCDFAACECGPASFLISGGFDGSSVTLQLQLCTLRRCSSSSSRQQQTHVSAAEHQMGVCSPAPTSTDPASGKQSGQDAPLDRASSRTHPVTAHPCTAQPVQTADSGSATQDTDVREWAQAWCCSWELLRPRTRTPPGRCHHSCSWHAGSQSLVVFGGYNSHQGCLDDLHVFSMLHQAWWQPVQSGEAQPCDVCWSHDDDCTDCCTCTCYCNNCPGLNQVRSNTTAFASAMHMHGGLHQRGAIGKQI